ILARSWSSLDGARKARGELMTGADTELREDVGQVVLDRLGGQVQLGRHLAIGLARRHQPGHNLLSRGQTIVILGASRLTVNATRGKLGVEPLEERASAKHLKLLTGEAQRRDRFPAASRRAEKVPIVQ